MTRIQAIREAAEDQAPMPEPHAAVTVREIAPKLLPVTLDAVRQAYVALNYSFFTYGGGAGLAAHHVDTLEGVFIRLRDGFQHADFQHARQWLTANGYDVTRFKQGRGLKLPPAPRFPRLRPGLIIDGARLDDKRVAPLAPIDGGGPERFKRGDKTPALSRATYNLMIAAPMPNDDKMHNTFMLGFADGVINYALQVAHDGGCKNAGGINRNEVNKAFERFRRDGAAFCGLARVGLDMNRRFQAGYGAVHLDAFAPPYIVLSINLDGVRMVRFDGRSLRKVDSFRLVR